MPLPASMETMAADVSCEIGIGEPSELNRWIDVASRTPRRSRKSCSRKAASYGAGGHLKNGPSTLITATPDSKVGRTSDTRSAPAGE